MTIQFWVAGNIIFDLTTGATNQVLMLVDRENAATAFTEKDAQTYFAFVKNRAEYVQWFLEPPTPQRPGWVIRGVQTSPL